MTLSLSSRVAFQLIDEPNLVAGFVFGLSYPSVLLRLRAPEVPVEVRATLQQAFLALLRSADDPALARSSVSENLIGELNNCLTAGEWLATMLAEFNRMARLPVFQRPHTGLIEDNLILVALPTLARGLIPLAELSRLTLKALTEGTDSIPATEVRANLDRLRAANLRTSNTPRFVQAAVANGISFEEIVGTQVVQFGLGRNSTLLDSTFTQQTPSIAARFAKLKNEAAVMLRRQRLPVPEHVMVSNEREACEAAAAIGYPVVVKPADKDGGAGVQADLRDKDELIAAFRTAQTVSSRILVEKFVTGRDYRITVLRNKCIWAVEREPAGVLADGVHSISDLVNEANSDPRRGTGEHAPLKLLKLDDEAHGLLARDGLTPESIPPTGTFIRLRRAANISSGGMPKAVFDKVHPDNAALAVRAARALKLDLAGVDLLIPDIAISWRLSGAAICEVNGQPELGGVTSAQVYPQVLRELLNQTNGHIPIIAVLGRERAEELGEKINEALLAEGWVPGLHNRAGIKVGRALLDQGPVPQLAAGRMLASNQSVDALVFGATNCGVRLHGFPVHRVDLLILTGEPLEPVLGSSRTPSRDEMLESVQAMVPSARKCLILDAGSGTCDDLRPPFSDVLKAFAVVREDQLMAEVRRLAQPAGRAHSRI